MADKKRRPNGFTDAELKAYDGLSKTELFEVLGHVMRKGYTPPADLDLAKAIKAINAEINPHSGESAAGSGDRILSGAQYLALTAISAHAGGMPAALYSSIQKEHRESFQTRGFVLTSEGGAVTVTDAGNKALDRYEIAQREKAAAKSGDGGGQTTGGQPAPNQGVQAASGATGGGPTLVQTPAASQPDPNAGTGAQPSQPDPNAGTAGNVDAGGVGDFGG